MHLCYYAGRGKDKKEKSTKSHVAHPQELSQIIQGKRVPHPSAQFVPVHDKDGRMRELTGYQLPSLTICDLFHRLVTITLDVVVVKNLGVPAEHTS
jgi:hypothetical protein